MQDLVGRTLGHYRILPEIGRGGMGVVYRAHDELLDRDVAVKVLPEEVPGNRDRLARFEREARALAALNHPNIAAVFGLETVDSGTETETETGTGSDTGSKPQAASPRSFLVMELLEGESLRQRIPSSGMGWQKAVEIGAAVADGLAAAHGKGIVHRDLKPENIFLTAEGRVKILDFGLAQMKEPVHEEAETATLTPAGTLPGTVMGTVGYMSPEQVRGQGADERSDIFALGCVLHEMLTGKSVFDRESTADIQAAILKEDPPPLASSGVALPAELERTVSRCLEKSPEARFQSASDLCFALRSITTDNVLPVSSETAFSAFGQWKAWRKAALVVVVGIGAIVSMMGFGIFDWPFRDVEKMQTRTIALLPLVNLTGDPTQQYFVDGLHDELIATFTQISAFDKVIGRTSVMAFRDSNTPIREIGIRLDVAAVLEGSVRQSANTVRVTLQLIDSTTEENLWAESFERDYTDILELQSEVAVTVAREVRASLTPDEERRFSSNRKVNKEAYQLYLQAIRLSPWMTSEQDLVKAIPLFEKAIEVDPTYAEAYLGFGRALLQLAHFFRPSIELMPEAQAAIEKALEIDEDLSAAHTRLGTIKLWWLWDFQGAESEYRRGLELNPNGGYELVMYSAFLAITGRADDAISLVERAVELDPLNPDTLANVGWAHYLSRRFVEGIEQMESAQFLFPKNFGVSWELAANYIGAGRYEDAVNEIESFSNVYPASQSNPFMLATYIWALGKSGRNAEALEALRELEKLASTRHVPSSLFAWAYHSVGNNERAIDMLQKAFQERETQLMTLLASPGLDSLRTDDRLQRILHEMNFKEEWR